MAVHLVQQLPESLEQILTVLWGCLSEMKDDLSSSVGAVMEFLGESLYRTQSVFLTVPSGKLVTYDKVIDILANESVAYVIQLPTVRLRSL